MGRTSYEQCEHGTDSMHVTGDSADGPDTPMAEAAQLGIVRKAAACIDDSLVTCAPRHAAQALRARASC